jgi:arylsulfatase
VPKDRPIDGVDQSRFFLGADDKSAREGILIWCADRLQAVKWRTLQDAPVSAGHHGLAAGEARRAQAVQPVRTQHPREDDDKPTVDSWVVGRC